MLSGSYNIKFQILVVEVKQCMMGIYLYLYYFVLLIVYDLLGDCGIVKSMFKVYFKRFILIVLLFIDLLFYDIEFLKFMS